MRSILLFLVLLCFTYAVNSQVNQCIIDRYGDAPTFDSLDIERTELTFSIEETWPSTVLDTLKLEVFMPNSAIDPITQRPFILLIHGGSFLEGDRSDMNYLCMELARRGYVAATMDYRLGWDCSPTTAYCIGCATQAGKLKTAVYRAVQDARAAMRFIVDNATALGVDTSYLFIQGTSAGAITALHTAFWDQTEADNFCPTCTADLGTLDDSGIASNTTFSIKAVVNNCGAVNNLDITNGESIPTISFHDQVDCIVPNDGNTVINCLGCSGFFYVSGSQYISNRQTSNGICNVMNTVPGFAPQHCSYPVNAIIGKESCFLKSILCDNCSTSSTTNIWDIPDCSDGTTSVGLPPVANLDALKIFPNPSSGSVSIRSYSAEPLSVTLMTLGGRVLKKIDAVLNEDSINLTSFESGIYTLVIATENGQITTRKLVLMND